MSDDVADKVKDEELKKSLSHYRTVMSFMGANVPIEALCLPKEIETILLKADYLRVYDLIGCDIGEIKGIGPSRASILTARLQEFFTISI